MQMAPGGLPVQQMPNMPNAQGTPMGNVQGMQGMQGVQGMQGMQGMPGIMGAVPMMGGFHMPIPPQMMPAAVRIERIHKILA